MVKIFKNLISRFAKRKEINFQKERLINTKVELCLVVYVKRSKDAEALIEILRTYAPIADFNLVDGIEFVFYSNIKLREIIEQHVKKVQEQISCYLSEGELILNFDREGRLCVPPMGAAIREALIGASRLGVAR